MMGRMPDEVVWRKSKLGFEAPEDVWLPRHLPVMREKVLASPLLSRLCDRQRLSGMFEGLDLRSRWRLYSIALWEEAFNVTI
jgi:asparagine synthase (glutamine-hydrolysing)